MALSLSRVGRKHSFGDLRAVVVDVTFDSEYATGGESFLPGDVGLSRIDHVSCGAAQVADGTTALIVNYDASDNTLKVYEAADAAPFAEIGADDIALYTARLIVFGR